MNSATGYFRCRKRHPGTTGEREKDEVSRFVSQIFSRHCPPLSNLTRSQNQPTSNIPYPKEMWPFNSCLSQSSEICFMFWKKLYTFNRPDPFLSGLVGWRRSKLLHGKLVCKLALVHLTTWVGVQYLKAFPVMYLQGGGPEPSGWISSVLGEAEAEGSHFVWTLTCQSAISIPFFKTSLPLGNILIPLLSWLESLMPPLSPASYLSLLSRIPCIGHATLKPLMLYLLCTGLSLGSRLQYCEGKTVCKAASCF